MRTLTEIVKDIEECEQNLTLEPNAVDSRVRSGVEAIVRNAQSKLPTLKNEYRNAINKHVLLIGVHGKGAKEFANIARYVFKTATANYNAVTQRVKDNFLKRSARREFTNNEMFFLIDELNKMKVEFNILSLPQPTFNFGTNQLFGQDTDTVIDTVIRHNYGDQLHTIALLNDIFEVALKSKFHGNLLPVVVFNEISDHLVVDEAFLPVITASYDVPATVDDDFVNKVLTEVRKSLKATVVKEEEPVVVSEPVAEVAPTTVAQEVKVEEKVVASQPVQKPVVHSRRNSSNVTRRQV